MPCSDGGYGRDYCYGNCGSAEVSRLSARNDELANENCLLRETVIKLATAKPGTMVEVDPKVMKLIMKNQVDHRKEDLKRLEKTFRELISKEPDDGIHPLVNYYELLGRVMMANPEEPLEPQLGFDPDAY